MKEKEKTQTDRVVKGFKSQTKALVPIQEFLEQHTKRRDQVPGGCEGENPGNFGRFRRPGIKVEK